MKEDGTGGAGSPEMLKAIQELGAKLGLPEPTVIVGALIMERKIAIHFPGHPEHGFTVCLNDAEAFVGALNSAINAIKKEGGENGPSNNN